jgi:hypothetical protein
MKPMNPTWSIYNDELLEDKMIIVVITALWGWSSGYIISCYYCPTVAMNKPSISESAAINPNRKTNEHHDACMGWKKINSTYCLSAALKGPKFIAGGWLLLFSIDAFQVFWLWRLSWLSCIRLDRSCSWVLTSCSFSSSQH